MGRPYTPNSSWWQQGTAATSSSVCLRFGWELKPIAGCPLLPPALQLPARQGVGLEGTPPDSVPKLSHLHSGVSTRRESRFPSEFHHARQGSLTGWWFSTAVVPQLHKHAVPWHPNHGTARMTLLGSRERQEQGGSAERFAPDSPRPSSWHCSCTWQFSQACLEKQGGGGVATSAQHGFVAAVSHHQWGPHRPEEVPSALNHLQCARCVCWGRQWGCAAAVGKPLLVCDTVGQQGSRAQSRRCLLAWGRHAAPVVGSGALCQAWAAYVTLNILFVNPPAKYRVRLDIITLMK